MPLARKSFMRRSYINRRTPMPRGTKPLRSKKEAELKTVRLRRARTALAEASGRLGRRTDYEAQLRNLDAQIVKIRDGFECVLCKADGLPTVGILDCGHLYPRSLFQAGKHLLENQFAQCRRHNTLHIRCPEIFMTWFVETHGQEAHERLHALVTGPSPSTEQLAAWVKERTELLEQMRSDTEIAA